MYFINNKLDIRTLVFVKPFKNILYGYILSLIIAQTAIIII